MKLFHLHILLLSFLVLLSAQTARAASTDEEVIQPSSNLDVTKIYRLDTGDRIRLIVYGESDLSGEFEVDGSGELSLPLVGNVTATQLSLRELEQVITEKFKDGYLINPRVSIEVLNFRPFFILGEVKRPGSYPYVSNLTVVNAVALAGGYTYRAKTSSFTILRGKGDAREEMKGKEDTVILPGDTIRVDERFF